MTYNTKISGVGSYLPPKVVTNTDLEKLLDTNDEWIVQRTGIQRRRWVTEKVSTSDLALEASLAAIEDAGIDKTQLDMIIFATLSPDHDFPGTGCFLQAKLDVPGIPVFDIRQQCSGFIYGMSLADQYIKSGTYNHVLVVGAEVHSKAMDLTPEGRNVSVLFGDGAGAMVLSRTEIKSSKEDSHIIRTDLHANGKYAKELWIAGPGSGMDKPVRLDQEMMDGKDLYPQMNGKAVFIHAVKRMSESLKNSCEQSEVKIEDIDLFLFHQANLRINDKVGELLGIDSSKVFNTIQDYGNTTAATIPIGMADAIKAGVLKPGMLVASAAFGSGFTWASAIYRY